MRHQLDYEQWLPQPLDEVFTFFKNPANLEKITPPSLHFHILSQSTPTVEKGTRFNYILRLKGIPMWWQSEIVDWEENVLFTDLQKRGPYKHWKHTHYFEEKDGGTLIKDHIEYEVPFERLLLKYIQKDVQKIFNYRKEKLKELFI